jgi:exopolysaccharide biosynthesis polyprenyl glycosylphosphotransferase
MTANHWRGEGGFRRGARLLGDLAAASLSLGAALGLRIHVALPWTRGLLPVDRQPLFSREWAAIAVAQIATLYVFALYDPPRDRPRSETISRIVSAVLLQSALLVIYLFLIYRTFPRSVLLLYLVLDVIVLAGWRLVIDRVGRGARHRKVAIVGSGQAAREIVRTLAIHRSHAMTVVGFVPRPDEPEPDTEVAGELGRRLGTLADLPRLLAEGEIDDIILAAGGESWQTRLMDSLAGARPDHTNVLMLPGPFESLIGRMRYRWVHDLPLIEVVRESEWRINWPAKRLLDLFVGALLLIVAIPVLLVVALAVRLSSAGPILYRQRRVGRAQKPFTLIKFRTMKDDAEAESGEVLAQHGDARLTPTGAFLRRFRLDELPQLFNVLEGAMSMVGPRPERPGFVQRFLHEVPGYAERFALAPGLTGLAQINGEYHSSAENKLRYDLAYAANWSFWLDLSILLRTIKIVLTSRGV